MTPDFRPSIRRALAAQPRSRWLDRLLGRTPRQQVEASKAARRRHLWQLMRELWPALAGDVRQRWAALKAEGVRRGYWGDTFNSQISARKMGIALGYFTAADLEAADRRCREFTFKLSLKP